MALAAGAVAAAGLGWALFEAQWVEFVKRDAPVRRLPPELDGFRVLHLSDFHLGTLSLNGRALARAVSWAAEEPVDLVAITGDLVSRGRGRRTLEKALARLRARHGIYAVLGNHDVASTRDPFSRPADLSGISGNGARLLEHSSVSFAAGAKTIQVVGLDPRRRDEPVDKLADPAADLRILLAHFPDAVERLRPESFHLVLAGHLHGGQICLPGPRGKLRLAHLHAPYWEGLFELPLGTLHVSRGLGTSFVPFRFLARPEATVLTLREGMFDR